jgi:hypothetical protein
MGLGLLGLVGFFMAHALAQRELYPDWAKRLMLFPVFMAGSMGIALNNSRAVWQALRRKRSPFVRTPKYDSVPRRGRRESIPAAMRGRIPAEVWLELGMAFYGASGLALLIWHGVWAGVPFQALCVLGFSVLVLPSLRPVPDPETRSTIPRVELADLSQNA